MKFKVLKGTKLFDQLNDVKAQMKSAKDEAFALSKELGFTKIRMSGHCLSGGISGFGSETLPDGYRWIRGAVYPKKTSKKGKEIIARIDSLPKVEFDAINKPLKFDSFNYNEKANNGDGSFKIQWHPGIQWKDSFILLDVAEHMNYKPVKDMIEITCSEYDKMSKTKALITL